MSMRKILLSAAAIAIAAATAAVPASAKAVPGPVPVVHGFSQVSQARAASFPHTHLPRIVQRNAANGMATSSNWAGYADVACTTCKLRFVTADFSVPSVNCAASGTGTSGTFASHWAGLDGFTGNTVEQTGVTGYCPSGASGPAAYYAWYEMFPQPPVVFSGISPGDAVTASVYSTGTAWALRLADITTGGAIAVSLACPAGSACKNNSAEVISEDPGGAVANGYTLADFGHVNYLGTGVTSRSGTHGGLASNGLWTAFAITMVNGPDVMAVPGLAEGAAAFPLIWKASS